MADFRRILGLLLQERSYREVVAAVGCSHRDVAAASRLLQERAMTAAGLAALSDSELAELFPDGRSRVSREYEPPDFSGVVSSLRLNEHFTLLQGWRSYVTGDSSLRKYGYAQYCHLFNEYALRHDIVATLHHTPGRAMFVDWAGDSIPLVDAVTGETVKAYLFVAVLPFSGYVFCRAYTSLKMEAWIDAHAQAFSFYGGVAAITVPDNASTATKRLKRGEAARFVTERYRQFADHYGTAIVPARVNHAKDKAAAESAVNTIYKRILGYLLEDVWTTLSDVNDEINERLHEVNHGIRRADGSTRFERFAEEEKPLLKPLPREAFEEVSWKELKAGRNYHVTTDYQHYSVPYGLAGQLLRVRITSSRITAFDGQLVVAEHTRKSGRKGQYSTNPEHVPPQHKEVSGLWSRRWFTERANTFGPATAQVITQILDRYEIEAQAYLDCQNILGSLGRNKPKLEAACQQLLNMRGIATYSMLKRLISSTSSNSDGRRPAPAKAASNTKRTSEGPLDAEPTGVLLRGPEYYREEES